MIDRYACLPRSLTRRGFGALLGAAVGKEFLSRRLNAFTGSPFTVALVPDPQWMAGDVGSLGDGLCGSASPGAYSSLIRWAVDNRNLPVNGTPLNVKGFLQVGDCANFSQANVFGNQQSRSVNAYALAEAASPRMFVVRCAGNHDYENGGTIVRRSNLSYMFREDKGGAWSPSNVSAIYGRGMDLGGGDVAYWGGAYPDPEFPESTANHYMRLSIQGMRIGILSLEFCPRSAVLNWAANIERNFGDHQWWVTTHGYQDTFGTVVDRSSTYGPNHYSLAAAPASNAGTEMWGGSDDTWTGLRTWRNLTGIFCGHWIDGYKSGWVWHRTPVTSTSSRSQTVQQIFCNAQEADNTAACHDGVLDTAHLLLLRLDPATSRMEAYMVSTDSLLWTGATGVRSSATPVQLFNVSMQAPPGDGPFPLPGRDPIRPPERTWRLRRR